MTLHVAHVSTEKIKCSFYTVVVKNRALAKHYDGSMNGFMAKYSARCNDHIAVGSFMGSDINEMIMDLLENGLTVDQDFTFFDAGRIALDQRLYPDNIQRRRTINLGVDWLKALYTSEGIYVFTDWHIQ